jgi:hypothetical protein
MEKTRASVNPGAKADRPAEALPALRPPPLHPERASDAPFRSLLAVPENQAGYLAEAKREIQSSAMRRLEALEEVHRKLVEQAHAIVEAARRDLALHDLPVHAIKLRGREYHLYEREDRSPGRFFSILTPDEHAQADPRSRHLASYRLNEDSSWTRLDGGALLDGIDGDRVDRTDRG